MYFVGIDSGSSYTKLVLTDSEGRPIHNGLLRTGGSSLKSAEKAFQEALAKTGLSVNDIAYVVATGYGRVSIPFANRTVTEIYCQSVGVYNEIPTARSIIDVGGQDIKGIRTEEGRVTDFVYNDKCAAGTGKFLEIVARTLEVEVSDLGPISKRSSKPATITATCAVFADSEIITLIANNVPVEDIVSGVHLSLARRVRSLVGRIGLEKDVVMTGGVALNEGFVAAMRAELGFDLKVPRLAIYTAAFGAALLAKQTSEKPTLTQPAVRPKSANA